MTDTRTCYRHPDRPAGVACQRCDRPICPACMVQASVGFHCPECVKAHGGQKVLRHRAIFAGARHPGLATQVLIGLNVAVFVISLGFGAGAGYDRNRFSDRFGLFGPCINDHEWYRIVTAGFLHAGLLHLAFNMFALYNIGPIIERFLGWQRFVVVYFASLIGGSLGALVLSPNDVTVGASGAIFGLLGALLVIYRAQRIDLMSSGLLTTVGINLLITFLIPGISKGGHVGGIVTGLVVGWIIVELPRRVRERQLATVLSLALIPVLFAGAIVVASSTAEAAVFCRLLR